MIIFQIKSRNQVIDDAEGKSLSHTRKFFIYFPKISIVKKYTHSLFEPLKYVLHVSTTVPLLCGRSFVEVTGLKTFCGRDTTSFKSFSGTLSPIPRA